MTRTDFSLLRARARSEFWGKVYYAGLFCTAAGMFTGSPETNAVGALVAAVGYASRDYFNPAPTSITPMTLYALLFGIWCGAAHVVGLQMAGTRYEELFFWHAAMEFNDLSQMLASMNIVVPLLMYDVLKGPIARSRLVASWPSVALPVTPHVMAVSYAALMAMDWLIKLSGSTFGLSGTFRSFAQIGTLLFLFVVSLDAFQPRPQLPRWTRILAFVAVPAATVHSLMFSYLRSNIVLPIFMVLLAAFMRKRVTRKVLVGAVAVGVLVTLVYRPLGNVRSSGNAGTERLNLVVAQYGSEPFVDDALVMLARAGEFYSLGAIFQIVADEGLYYGETLGYIVYAFIPRMIWPDKPLIAPGQWFAEKVGRGYRTEAGSFSNVVNMTLGGEFYLNFGWLGAFAGLSLLSAAFAALWPKAGFYIGAPNLTGMLLAGALVLQSLGAGFASALVQMAFSYIAVIALKWVAEGMLAHQAGRGKSTSRAVRAAAPVPVPAGRR